MNEAKLILQEYKLFFFLPIGLALGFLAQWLFIGHPIGISWLIFVLFFLVALDYSGRRAGIYVTRRNLWLWPTLLFFAAMVFIRANPFLTFLNIIATLGLLAFVVYYFAADPVLQLPLAGILVLPGRMMVQILTHIGPAASVGLPPGSSPKARRGQLVPIARGGILALPVIFVFAALFASADLVFNAYLQQLVGLEIEKVAPYLGRGVIMIFIALYVAGGLAASVIRGLRQKEEDESWVEGMTRRLPLKFSLNTVETGTIMILISGLFLCFILVQFRYLFGGQANISSEGFTYADYARRGFFELVLVAILTLTLILFLNWFTRRESKHQIKSFNALSSLLIGLVLLILVTAFYRMHLYEQAYGYTELRLLVLVFELWLGILLFWFLLTIWRRPEHFAGGFLVIVIGFVATLNVINPDALIVHHNMERYHQTSNLDIAYLTGLSADAVPELVKALPIIKNDNQPLELPYCHERLCPETMGEFLDDNLRARYKAMIEEKDWLVGRSFHLSRYQANRSLACYYSPNTAAVQFGVIKSICEAQGS